jgi:hypothetical protein
MGRPELAGIGFSKTSAGESYGRDSEGTKGAAASIENDRFGAKKSKKK